MESVETKGGAKKFDSNFNKEIHSEIVRAGKRTYFFDVKSTRNDEYYLTITESKKRFDDNGKVHFEKHKLFLYKEDFDKFANSLQEVVNFIRKNQPEKDDSSVDKKVEEKAEINDGLTGKLSDIKFEDI